MTLSDAVGTTFYNYAVPVDPCGRARFVATQLGKYSDAVVSFPMLGGHSVGCFGMSRRI